MKMHKSITLLETASGETQFSTKDHIPNPRNANRNKEGASAPSAMGIRASRKTIASGGTSELNLSDLVPASHRKTKSNSIMETAASSDAGTDTVESLPAGVAVADVVSQNSMIDVMAGILVRHDPRTLNETRANIYRDMYAYDATCGSAIDLLSKMPFSDFSLVGLKDEKMTKTFVDSIEALNIATLLPNAAVDYNVLGAVVLSTRWDDGDKCYKGIVAHRLDYCTLTQVPVYGVDPLIEVRLSSRLLEGLRDPRIQELYKDYIPNDLLELSGGASVALKPEHTIFIPRRGTTQDYGGVSLLQRALPAWLYEKALIRGTLDQVYKKQRATTHITVEPTEDWVPDQAEMQGLTQLFLNSDLDPLGSIITTRSGINVNEIRRGDDFWRWDQNYDVTEKIKLRAMGISETFVSGDASYSTMEQTLSTFMEGVRDFRNQMTREIFYEKIFPAISEANGYTRKKYGNLLREVAGAREIGRVGDTVMRYNDQGFLEAAISSSSGYRFSREFASNPSIKAADYVIPQVAWHKRLMPEADEAYLGVLSTLEEKGVPLGIRHWIAAGGFKAEALIDGFEEDLRTREKIFEYKQELKDLEKEYGINQQPSFGEGGEGEGGGGEGMSEEFASLLAQRRAGVMGAVVPQSILSRGNPDHPSAEIADYDSQGRRRVMTKKGRQYKLNRYNKVIAEACATLAQQENARTKQDADKIEKTKTIYT